MSQPLTFGVELEFNVAYLKQNVPIPPDVFESHTLHFPLEDDVRRYVAGIYDTLEGNSNQNQIDQSCDTAQVRQHIAKALTARGLPAYSDVESILPNTDMWRVTGDESVMVEDEDKGEYEWACVEVISPKFDFTPEILRQVKRVCDTIARRYKYRVNTTTGLHVHVGDDKRSFPLPVMKKLIAFLWAFEPQMNTIHPITRIDAEYAASMRNHSIIAEEFHRDNGYKLPAIHALSFISQFDSVPSLCDRTMKFFPERNVYYNYTPIAELAKGDITYSDRPTIEFRQHEGTLNSARVTTWIKTVVGLVDAVRKLPEVEFQKLVNTCANERWQKHGDGRDDAREAKFGPIPADSTFTVVDLLEYLGLNESAEFYKARGLYHHDYPDSSKARNPGYFRDENGVEQRRRTFENPDYLVYWHFEKDEVKYPKGSAAYTAMKAKVELWERTVESNNLNITLDPDYVPLDTTSNFWPAHTLTPRQVTPPESDEDTEPSDEDTESSEDEDSRRSGDSESTGSAGSGSAPRWTGPGPSPSPPRASPSRRRGAPEGSEESPPRRQRRQSYYDAPGI